ncbi:MAG: hypothetical protein J6A69_08870 [Clostridia bacterium]|nr:hypothetical protein [Clostridia bacterium]
MNNVCTCDFHTHILPSIDDGAKSTDMSISLIKLEIEQGVKQLCFTPHFSSEDSTEEFINKRNTALELLNSEIERLNLKSVPKFYTGAEIALDYKTPEINGLEKLCIGETDLLLLEPPYSYWGEWIPDVIYRISAKLSLTPVIAHADRYIDNKQSLKILNNLADMDVLMQFNSYNLTNSKTRSLIKKILSRGKVPFIGSDAHNPKFRSVTMNHTQSLKCRLFLPDDLIEKVNLQSEDLLKK